MASNASSDALGFPVRGMPKTVREKNIIFNVIKYFEDEKERHGKQKFRPNAVMQKAAEATGVPLRTLQRLSNANSESKKIKSKKAKLSREKFGKLDDFDLGVIRRLIHQFYLRNESPTLDKILKELKEKMDFPYGRSCLHKLLKKMGFSFKFRGKERLIHWKKPTCSTICRKHGISVELVWNHENSTLIPYCGSFKFHIIYAETEYQLWN